MGKKHTVNDASFRPHWAARLGNRYHGTQPPRTREARSNLRLVGATAMAFLALTTNYGGSAQAAPKLTVLFSFANVRGYTPYGTLLADGAGNLYGTTEGGGRKDGGEVFELTPPAPGQTAWAETVLFSFKRDGGAPEAGLIMDGAGNLYGTTVLGGARGQGAVFELSPPGAGQTAWPETVLVSFGGTNGAAPEGPVVADGAGNLYGTTAQGGDSAHCAGGCGTVFELTHPTGGNTAWTETLLHSFGGTDGFFPRGGLIVDGAGNLYGTTSEGGVNNDGVAFELTPPAMGQTAWTETTLFAFNGANGTEPEGTLLADRAGNFYGTTAIGGANDVGVVYELIPPAMGQTAWTETVLHSFGKPQGAVPVGSLIADGAGNLYGATLYDRGRGGRRRLGGDGLVFELTPPPAGQTDWSETVLKSFDGTDGANPAAGLIADSAGNLYGVTADGGASGEGVAFKLTP